MRILKDGIQIGELDELTMSVTTEDKSLSRLFRDLKKNGIPARVGGMRRRGRTVTLWDGIELVPFNRDNSGRLADYLREMGYAVD